MPSKTIEFAPKQLAFFNASDYFVLFSGGVGSGKSLPMLYKLIARASVPGACEGLFRKTFGGLNATALDPLRELLNNHAPGAWEENKLERIIRIKGGGIIRYSSIDDPIKIRSLNLTGAAIDELTELEEQDYAEITNRVRKVVDGLPVQIYGCTNPAPPSHWLASLLGLDELSINDQLEILKETNGKVIQQHASEGADVRYRLIMGKTDDNPHLSPEYVATQRRKTGIAKLRDYLGLWIAAEGLVYDNFNRAHHVVERTDNDWKNRILCVDWGVSIDPFVCLVVAIDEHDRWHIESEFYQTGMLVQQQLSKINEIREGWEDVVIDPSATELRTQALKQGLPVKGTRTPRMAGVARVRDYLGIGSDGLPRLTVAPSCINLIREFESYAYKPGTEEPQDKKNDHCLDALRYGLMEQQHRHKIYAAFGGQDAMPIEQSIRDRTNAAQHAVSDRRNLQVGEHGGKADYGANYRQYFGRL